MKSLEEKRKDIQNRFGQETGEKHWINPVCHGNYAFASWQYQNWLEDKLSDALEILKDSYNNEISNDGTNCTNPATNLPYTLDELYQIPKRTGCTFEELIERVTGKKPEKTYSKEEVEELLKEFVELALSDLHLSHSDYLLVREAMVNALQEDREQRWISVEDKLPPINTGIIVTDRKKITVCELKPLGNTFFMTGHNFGGYEWEFDFNYKDITHWMPLPHFETREE